MSQHKTSKRSRKSKKSKRTKDSKKSKGGLEKSDTKVQQYMTKLCKHLEENKLLHFWVEADGKFSNKIHGNKDNFEKLIKKNPSKFINKTFCYFQGCCHFDNPHSLWYSKGVLINYRLTPFHVNEKSELKDSGRTLSILWKKEDLQVTKVTMKFLEQLMKIMVTTKFAMASIAGFHIKQVLGELKLEKIKIDPKYLTPLT